jgi:uncharacterized protein with HEPN domain
MKGSIITSKERIEHILESIETIEHFLESHSLESFVHHRLTTSACLHEFTIIGEATARIDPELLARHPYPWHRVKAFRNFIVHEYQGIEMRQVWDTAQNTLPGLKKILGEILEKEFTGSGTAG